MFRALYSASLLVLLLTLAGRDAVASGTGIALVPSSIQIDPGEEFTVEVRVPVTGDPINGYDAIVGFDPQRLQVLVPVPASQGEGALFTAACPQRFLSVQVAPDSTQVSIAHVLLCAGTTVTGPGTVFVLRFRARQVTGPTALQLLPGTTAYDAGAPVEPLETSDAEVLVGTSTGAAPIRPDAGRFLARPNPFNPRTELYFDSARMQQIRIELFTVSGRALGTLFEGAIGPGPFRTVWDGRDPGGHALGSGVYLARLSTSAGAAWITRLVLIR